MASESSTINHFYLQDQEIKRLQFSIAIVTIIMSCFAIFLTIIFFIFNIRYRNFRLIKMSSPNINNIINFNCILLYLCPILNSIKGLNIGNELLASIMCQANTWILPLSSTAIYAAMLTKAWRIYKIFETTPKAKKIVIKDLRLVCYIGCLMFFDAAIVLVWQLADTIKLKPRFLYEIQTQPTQVVLPSSYLVKFPTSTNFDSTAIPFRLLSNDSGSQLAELDMAYLMTTTTPVNLLNEASSLPIVQNYSRKNQLKLVFECNSSYNEVWITILTMYKIILLMYGIYLAWIIRNINVPSMNDSKYLLLSTYTIIVCGLGSMTLMQLLGNWPDVVQAFFTIGIILSTCTTQCLLFIPKIRLWYKRKNDDNFKISLSQIFLHSSSNCYYTDKQTRSSANPTSSTNMLNLEDELCELLHENSQLKNFLKEKEEIIKLLQDKIRMAKAKLFQVSAGVTSNCEMMQKKTLLAARSESNNNNNNNNESRTDLLYDLCHPSKLNQTVELNVCSMTNGGGGGGGGGASVSAVNLNANSLQINQQTNVVGAQSTNNSVGNNLDSGFDVDSSTCTATTTTETIRTGLVDAKNAACNRSQTLFSSSSNMCNKQQHAIFSQSNTEQLKNDLDEVEELTSRVRDSISVDLSNTRRYSPLLYEYYRKQLELAKSIQCTYNIQCNSLFDAMTLMRRCLRDYCQTVHNPEYLAIDAIHSVKSNSTHDYSYNDFLSHTSLNRLESQSQNYSINTNNLVTLPPLPPPPPPPPLSHLAQNVNCSFKDQQQANSSFESSSKINPSTNTTVVNQTSSSNTTATTSGSASFASTCSLSSSNKNLFSNVNYDSTNLVDALDFNFDSNNNNNNNISSGSSNSSNLKQQHTPSSIDNKQTYV